jgi:hypothetical protein
MVEKAKKDYYGGEAKRRLMIFQSDTDSIRRLSIIRSLRRLFAVLSAIYIPSNFNPVIHQKGMAALTQILTVLTLALTGAIYAVTNRTMTTFIYKIEYDAITNQFVITQPSKSLMQFGKPFETILELRDFKMLSKDEME